MKGIIISVVFVVVGLGVMANFKQESTIRTAGGGLFLLGLAMLGIFLVRIIKK